MRFDSFEAALNDWFEQPLQKLPEDLRRRVEKAFPQLHWENGTLDTRSRVMLEGRLTPKELREAAQRAQAWEETATAGSGE